MKKVLLAVGILFLILILIGVIATLIVHKPRPSGQPGPEADALAERMMHAVNKEGWDSTRWVGWTFLGMHDYIWDKDRHLVEVRWNGYRVLLDPNTISGKAWKKDIPLEGTALNKAIHKAWTFFCNDSFWLNAVVKAFDPGTVRSIVPMEDGSQGLLVEYQSGGVTPGDAYLWILDDTYRPKAWQMWVQVLPIGGIQTSWENWITFPTGALVASAHKTPLGGMKLTNIRGGMTLQDVGLDQDPFAGFPVH